MATWKQAKRFAGDTLLLGDGRPQVRILSGALRISWIRRVSGHSRWRCKEPPSIIQQAF